MDSIRLFGFKRGVVVVVLYVAAFALTIPPVPSEEGHRNHFLPSGAYAILLFAGASWLGRKSMPTVWMAIAKVILFAGYAWLLAERMTYC